VVLVRSQSLNNSKSLQLLLRTGSCCESNFATDSTVFLAAVAVQMIADAVTEFVRVGSQEM
jgi:hypothetical protein